MTFEMFMTKWENLMEQHEILRPWIDIGLRWVTKYYTQMDDMEAYIVTMFLNPAMHMSWIQSQWEAKYIQSSKNTILRLMNRYRNQNPTPTAPTAIRNPSDKPVPGQWLNCAQCSLKLSVLSTRRNPLSHSL
ncbi:hypothetical protein EI94DRAFT_1034944 [Lactarius quietus]|nr:hypothetical protein EI94DRAFT_1034944 [Lactarius quietus]